MVYINFVPKDGKLCEKCVWADICPYDYQCETYERNYVFEMFNNVRNGNSTEKVR